MKRLTNLLCVLLCTPAWMGLQAQVANESTATAIAEPAQAESESSEDITVEASKPKKICRFEKPTGSIRAVRVCFTQEELEQREKEAQLTLGFLADEQRKRENAIRNRPED